MERYPLPMGVSKGPESKGESHTLEGELELADCAHGVLGYQVPLLSDALFMDFVELPIDGNFGSIKDVDDGL